MKKFKTSLFGQYIKERAGHGIVETKDGFATFSYPSDDTVYIIDLYVVPKKRKLGIAAQFADTIVAEALKTGRKYLLGSVDLQAKGAEDSIKVLLAYGMQFHKKAEPMLYFVKQIADKPIETAKVEEVIT